MHEDENEQEAPSGYSEVVGSADDERGEGKARTNPTNPKAERWAAQVRDLGASGRSLLQVLAAHSDKYGCSFCSQPLLAELAQISERTVRTKLALLRHRKLISQHIRWTSKGGRKTNVTLLREWPDRVVTPDGKHPSLGIPLQTDAEAAITQLRERMIRQNSLHLPEMLASTEQVRLQQEVSYCAEEEERLAEAFRALGRWATAENREHLHRDGSQLFEWLRAGLDWPAFLDLLRNRSKSDRRDVPVLRRWSYFEKAIRPLMGRKGKLTSDRQPSRPAIIGAAERAEDRHPRGQARRAKSDADIVLGRLVKQMPGKDWSDV